MRRLICAFVVRIWHKLVFSWRGSVQLFHPWKFENAQKDKVHISYDCAFSWYYREDKDESESVQKFWGKDCSLFTCYFVINKIKSCSVLLLKVYTDNKISALSGHSYNLVIVVIVCKIYFHLRLVCRLLNEGAWISGILHMGMGILRKSQFCGQN